VAVWLSAFMNCPFLVWNAGGRLRRRGRGSRGGVERFDAARHGNANARMRALRSTSREACAFVADKQRDGSHNRLPTARAALFRHRRIRERKTLGAHVGDAKLREQIAATSQLESGDAARRRRKRATAFVKNGLAVRFGPKPR